MVNAVSNLGLAASLTFTVLCARCRLAHSSLPRSLPRFPSFRPPGLRRTGVKAAESRSTRRARKSLTLLWVGPVTTRSPRASKKVWESFASRNRQGSVRARCARACIRAKQSAGSRRRAIHPVAVAGDGGEAAGVYRGSGDGGGRARGTPCSVPLARLPARSQWSHPPPE